MTYFKSHKLRVGWWEWGWWPICIIQTALISQLRDLSKEMLQDRLHTQLGWVDVGGGGGQFVLFKLH